MLNWQLVVVGLIVCCATAYMVHSGWRAWRGRKGGCGGGSCASSGKAGEQRDGLIPRQGLTLRRRDSGNIT
jgi:hypothetical protein